MDFMGTAGRGRPICFLHEGHWDQLFTTMGAAKDAASFRETGLGLTVRCHSRPFCSQLRSAVLPMQVSEWVRM